MFVELSKLWLRDVTCPSLPARCSSRDVSLRNSQGFFGSSAAWGVCVVEEPGNFGFGASFNAIKATVRVLVVGS